VSDSGYYDTVGFPGSSQATVLTEPEDRLQEETSPSTRWHGGLDFGLLIMRVALGGTLGAHGLQKVFGLFNGPGIGEFARILGDYGFTSQTTLLSWLGGVGEIAGGGLLILGLFTPAAAATLLSITVTAVYLHHRAGFFLGATGSPNGFEYRLVLAAMALGLLFTGPGRVSLDVNTPWRRSPVPFGIVGLVLAGGAVAGVVLSFR
jgi:putative oxidoreductase